jgi:hypothetical protein
MNRASSKKNAGAKPVVDHSPKLSCKEVDVTIAGLTKYRDVMMLMVSAVALAQAKGILTQADCVMIRNLFCMRMAQGFGKPSK